MRVHQGLSNALQEALGPRNAWFIIRYKPDIYTHLGVYYGRAETNPGRIPATIYSERLSPDPLPAPAPAAAAAAAAPAAAARHSGGAVPAQLEAAAAAAEQAGGEPLGEPGLAVREREGGGSLAEASDTIREPDGPVEEAAAGPAAAASLAGRPERPRVERAQQVQQEQQAQQEQQMQQAQQEQPVAGLPPTLADPSLSMFSVLFGGPADVAAAAEPATAAPSEGLQAAGDAASVAQASPAPALAAATEGSGQGAPAEVAATGATASAECGHGKDSVDGRGQPANNPGTAQSPGAAAPAPARAATTAAGGSQESLWEASIRQPGEAWRDRLPSGSQESQGARLTLRQKMALRQKKAQEEVGMN
jgi:hypothetical protein